MPKGGKSVAFNIEKTKNKKQKTKNKKQKQNQKQKPTTTKKKERKECVPNKIVVIKERFDRSLFLLYSFLPGGLLEFISNIHLNKP